MMTASVRGIALQSAAMLLRGEGREVQLPLEDNTLLLGVGIYEDLLISGTHKWEGVANAINGMAHHHKITEQIVGGRHLVPLGLLDVAVFLGATGDCTVANQVMVRAYVPPLYLVQPGGDVVQVVDQVRIVGAAVGRGDERTVQSNSFENWGTLHRGTWHSPPALPPSGESR
jgi:hypothetical protein